MEVEELKRTVIVFILCTIVGILIEIAPGWIKAEIGIGRLSLGDVPDFIIGISTGFFLEFLGPMTVGAIIFSYAFLIILSKVVYFISLGYPPSPFLMYIINLFWLTFFNCGFFFLARGYKKADRWLIVIGILFFLVWVFFQLI